MKEADVGAEVTRPGGAELAVEQSGPSFAVAFGGGGARGLSHIHVIEVLDEDVVVIVAERLDGKGPG